MLRCISCIILYDNNMVLFIQVILIEMCGSFMNKSIKISEHRKSVAQYYVNNLILMKQRLMFTGQKPHSVS